MNQIKIKLEGATAAKFDSNQIPLNPMDKDMKLGDKIRIGGGVGTIVNILIDSIEIEGCFYLSPGDENGEKWKMQMKRDVNFQWDELNERWNLTT